MFLDLVFVGNWCLLIWIMVFGVVVREDFGGFGIFGFDLRKVNFGFSNLVFVLVSLLVRVWVGFDFLV